MAPHMYVADSGPADAPVVILLHPMSHSGTIWDRHRELLSERFRVIAPDLPGHGRSDGPFTVAGAIDALDGLIAEAAPGEPVHLAGLSLGARIGLLFAADHELASLMLVGCGLGSENITSASRTLTRILPARFFPGGVDGASKQTVLAAMNELGALDLRSALPKVKARTLVAVGEKDAPYLATAREIAEAIPGAELRTIEGGAHLWPKDRVDDFVNLLTEWVAPVRS